MEDRNSWLILVIESHAETIPSLRVDKPFEALIKHSLELDFKNMDPTDHGHVPYIVILVRAMEEWKASVRSHPSSIHNRSLTFRVLVAWRTATDELSSEARIQEVRPLAGDQIR